MIHRLSAYPLVSWSSQRVQELLNRINDEQDNILYYKKIMILRKAVCDMMNKSTFNNNNLYLSCISIIASISANRILWYFGHLYLKNISKISRICSVFHPFFQTGVSSSSLDLLLFGFVLIEYVPHDRFHYWQINLDDFSKLKF